MTQPSPAEIFAAMVDLGETRDPDAIRSLLKLCRTAIPLIAIQHACTMQFKLTQHLSAQVAVRTALAAGLELGLKIAEMRAYTGPERRTQ